MADVFDQAQDLVLRENELARMAQQRLASHAPKLEPTGECQNPLCGEPLDGARLFCGPDCAKEHAKRVK
jgi:hypothetical protein